MEIEEIKNNTGVDAILEVGLPGGYGFYGVADVLSGEVNPSGHMPVSVPAFREQIISDENFAEQTEQVTYREGMFMGYRGYETKKNSSAVSVWIRTFVYNI